MLLVQAGLETTASAMSFAFHYLATHPEERDRLIAGLQQAGVTKEVFWLDGFQQLEGRNGGGDPWRTDGRLGSVILAVPPGKTDR